MGTDTTAAANAAQLAKALKAGASVLALCTVMVPSVATAYSVQATQPANQDSTQAAGQTEGITSNPSDPVEESNAADNTVVVTGIRRSLQRSRDIKRDSDVVVDSVSSDDISALPDRSVTEALQRIPGVAIDRFSAGRDPDHFSTEGSGVVVRGLTYTRSELNGRDTFTANNGRGLSFSDVPSELLGGVDVFKSPSADMVEGGISGTVNLRTRVPFDQEKRLVVAGSAELSYGDMRQEAAPTFSIIASNRWTTPIGDLGLLGSYARSKLKFRSDGIQISDFGTRDLFSNGTRNDVVPFDGATEQGTVYVPRGAALRTQDTDRERIGYSAAAQWRSTDRSVLATLQFLRSDSRESWSERAFEVATDNVTAAGDSRAVPGTSLSFDDDGVFDNGVITGPTGWRDDQNNTAAWGGNGDVRTPRFGLQSNNINRGVEARNVTTDYSANVKWNVTSQLTLNLDYQHVTSKVKNLDVGLWTSSFQNLFVDLNGKKLPTVEFRPPEVCVGPATNSPCTDLAGGASDQNPSYFGPGNASFTSPFNTFYRSVMDHVEDSDGNQDAARIDLDYAFGDNNWLSAIRVGARYADRKNVARFSAYNWGVLSEIWGGGGPVWLSDNVDGIPGGTGGAPLNVTQPFGFPDFMRGKAGDPFLGDPRLYYSGNPVANYAGFIDLAKQIRNEWRDGPYTGGAQGWVPLAERPGAIAGTNYLPGEINPVAENNKAAYAMLRFKHEFGGGRLLSGNIGVRYSRTERQADGQQVFLLGNFQTEEQCANPPVNPETGEPGVPTPFCTLPIAVRNNARLFANGAATDSSVTLKYDYWLPSFNARLEMGGGLQFRVAYSKSITPPDFGLTRNFYNVTLGASQQDIDTNGGPIARATVGNPYLKPIEGTNIDLSAEYYFGRNGVGQLTVAAFHKSLKGVLTNGTQRIPFTNNGATFDALITTPVNADETGKVRGFEVAYQQTYDFLPGFLSGFGLNATYTYVKSSGVRQSTLSETDPDVAAGQVSNVDTSLLPLQGLSKHTINFTPFYEKGPLSIRLAYNWRSKFLLTTRDVIVPFAPIFNESTGQLDGSIFYSVNPKFRIGVQAVNLTNEVTRTSSVINNDLLTAPRSWFMNDRRFTGVVRITL
nr:TonB-dependent receptor [uncultured Sphingomonas sp.]